VFLNTLLGQQTFQQFTVAYLHYTPNQFLFEKEHAQKPRRGSRSSTTKNRQSQTNKQANSNMVKVVGIAIVRTGSDLNEPIPLVTANDLSSFGFFQRQVRACVRLMLRRRRIFFFSFSSATSVMVLLVVAVIWTRGAENL
jgi:hypothetical protein